DRVGMVLLDQRLEVAFLLGGHVAALGGGEDALQGHPRTEPLETAALVELFLGLREIAGTAGGAGRQEAEVGGTGPGLQAGVEKLPGLAEVAPGYGLLGGAELGGGTPVRRRQQPAGEQ